MYGRRLFLAVDIVFSMNINTLGYLFICYETVPYVIKINNVQSMSIAALVSRHHLSMTEVKLVHDRVYAPDLIIEFKHQRISFARYPFGGQSSRSYP